MRKIFSVSRGLRRFCYRIIYASSGPFLKDSLCHFWKLENPYFYSIENGNVCIHSQYFTYRSMSVLRSMTDVYFNEPKSICSGSQYRVRLERKLASMLGEERIIGPLDPFIKRAVDEGKISGEVGDELYRISRFCDEVFMLPEDRCPDFEQIKAWSDIIEAL